MNAIEHRYLYVSEFNRTGQLILFLATESDVITQRYCNSLLSLLEDTQGHGAHLDAAS